MTSEERTRILIEEARASISELRWAAESRADGWSPHQMNSMRKRADAIEQKLHDLSIKS